MTALLGFPQDWQRALVIVAHPDDPEYGMAAAVAEWIAAGKQVSYVMATRGEAGIAGLAPEDSAPLRSREQENACARVGVTDLVFLDHPDGRIVEGLALRRDFAREIRRVRPDVVLTLNHREEWGPGRWNSADHRAVGRAVLDAVGDADNEWIFPELLADGLARHKTQWVAISSPQPTHAQQVSAASIELAVASLAAHKEYLRALSTDPVEEQARKQIDMVTGNGAVAFELTAESVSAAVSIDDTAAPWSVWAANQRMGNSWRAAHALFRGPGLDGGELKRGSGAASWAVGRGQGAAGRDSCTVSLGTCGKSGAWRAVDVRGLAKQAHSGDAENPHGQLR